MDGQDPSERDRLSRIGWLGFIFGLMGLSTGYAMRSAGASRNEVVLVASAVVFLLGFGRLIYEAVVGQGKLIADARLPPANQVILPPELLRQGWWVRFMSARGAIFHRPPKHPRAVIHSPPRMRAGRRLH